MLLIKKAIQLIKKSQHHSDSAEFNFIIICYNKEKQPRPVVIMNSRMSLQTNVQDGAYLYTSVAPAASFVKVHRPSLL